MSDEMDVTVHRAGEAVEHITLTTLTLGYYPYVLIQMKPASDGSGEPALFVEAGGGAEEDPPVLPVLYLTEVPAEANPITQELVRLRTEYTGAKDWAAVAVVERVADQLGVPMPEPEQ